MLIGTREINQACQDAAYGRGRYVFASTAELPTLRIVRAKTFNGVQKVLTLSGSWVVPTKVWTE